MSEGSDSFQFSGGCRCGSVRYQCSARPVFTAHCHCRDCQYASGGAYSTVILVPTDSVNMSGELSGFQVTAESGNQLTRRFCPNCGSPMLTELHSNPTMLVLKAATLDDPSWLEPTSHMWTGSGQPWAEMSGSLPAFERNPG